MSTDTPAIKDKKEATSPYLAHLAPCLLLGFLIAIKFPYDIYWGNVDQFSSWNVQLAAPLLLVMFIISIAAYLPIFILPRFTRTGYFIATSVIAMELWFIGNFLHKKQFVLDGRIWDFHLTAFTTWLEIIVCIALVALAIAMRKKIYTTIVQANVIFLALISMSSLAHYWQMANLQSPGNIQVDTTIQDSGTTFTNEFLTFSTERNVLLIILDELHSSVLAKTLEENAGIRSGLEGFILFEDTVGNHPNTIMSIPAMLTGESYKNEQPIKQYLNDAFSKKSITRHLDANGYRSDFHTLPIFCNGALYNCSPIAFGDGRGAAFFLLDLGLFRALPMALKPFIYADNTWLISSTLSKLLKIKKIPQDERAIILLENFTDNARASSVNPRFKLFHSMVTHNPETLDADCRHTKRRKGNTTEKVKQATCAMGLVTKLVAQLRRLGIYDETLIIIASDHGSDLVDNLDKDQLSERGITPRHVARSMASLMIKPIGATGALKISNTPAQLSDIPATVAESLLPPPTDMPGIDLLQAAGHPERERNYWHYEDLIVNTEFDRFPKMWHYSIQGPATKTEAWSLIEIIEAEP